MNQPLEHFSEQIDLVVDIDSQLGSVAGSRAVAIDAARLGSLALAADDTVDQQHKARRILVTEVAAALRLPERTTETLVEYSRVLVHELPATLAVLQSGRMSYRHATIMIDQVSGLSAENRAALEEKMLPKAVELTAAQFICRRCRPMRSLTGSPT
ncbi:hypothetical protein [Leifsonia sp. A12D58]|uniref:hypothetical protein n=1 Tax=Leifsonia sp. A12D58 TaxID=3397674 RepID=UPI0039E1F331